LAEVGRIVAVGDKRNDASSTELSRALIIGFQSDPPIETAQVVAESPPRLGAAPHQTQELVQEVRLDFGKT